jgi:hypothetical protein
MNTITSFGSTPALDNLRVPDGRRVGDLSHAETYSILGGLGIEGFSHNLGRADAVALYGRFLQSIFDEAGQKALDEFFRTHRS